MWVRFDGDGAGYAARHGNEMETVMAAHFENGVRGGEHVIEDQGGFQPPLVMIALVRRLCGRISRVELKRFFADMFQAYIGPKNNVPLPDQDFSHQL